MSVPVLVPDASDAPSPSTYHQCNLSDVPHTESRLLALTVKCVIYGENDRIMLGMESSEFDQAHIHWPEPGHQTDIHVYKPDDFFIHAHIPKLFIDTIPKPLLACAFGLPYPMV